jgi:hypothetical protein
MINVTSLIQLYASSFKSFNDEFKIVPATCWTSRDPADVFNYRRGQQTTASPSRLLSQSQSFLLFKIYCTIIRLCGIDNMMLRLVSMAILVVGASSSCEVCLDGGVPGNPLAMIGDFTCQYYYDNYLELKGTGQQCITAHLPENQVACGCGNTEAPLPADITSSPPISPPVTSAPVTFAPSAADFPTAVVSTAPIGPPVTSAPVTFAPSAADFPTALVSAITKDASGATHAFIMTSFCAIVLAMTTL